MKRFKEIREQKMPKGKHVFAKKVDGISLMIHKVDKGFAVYVDGEELDVYRSEAEAKKMGLQFAKELKGN